MRVISGSAKGILLRSPSTGETRPILGRAKEALFSILTVRTAGARFLDLFAGTGGVGIEALSRGAAESTFIEVSPRIVADLRINLERTRVFDRAVVKHMDVFDYLHQEPEAYDIVFVAPPQWHELWQQALLAIDDEPLWLAKDGIVVVQHDPKEYEKLALRHLKEYDRRRYSGVELAFYRATAAPKTVSGADATLEPSGDKGSTS